MKRFAFLALLLISAPARSQSPLAPGECAFRDAWTEEMTEAVDRGALVGKDLESTFKSLDAITAKAKNPDRPVIEQISADDAASFEKIRHDLVLPQLVALVERRRIRDLEVTKKMVALADQSYRFDIEPSEESSDGKVFSSLRLIRAAVDENSAQVTPPSGSCGIDGAIFSLQNDVLSKIASLDLARANILTQELRTKYKMEHSIEAEKLDGVDRQKWGIVWREIVLPSERARAYVLDLQAVRTALQASDIIYRSDLEDARKSKGDVDALGSSIKRRVESNEFAQPLVTAMGLWRLFNETGILGSNSIAEAASAGQSVPSELGVR